MEDQILDLYKEIKRELVAVAKDIADGNRCDENFTDLQFFSDAIRDYDGSQEWYNHYNF